MGRTAKGFSVLCICSDLHKLTAGECPSSQQQEFFVEHTLSMAGSGRINDAAETLLARIDKIMPAIKQASKITP